jgi:glutathione S-transferase
MKLYDVPNFPNPIRVRIALAEKGAGDAVTHVPVDVMGGEHRTAAYRAKNPDATVPCLELEDGTVISQCTAITEFIDGHFDGPALCGRTPKERAVVHMMNLRAESGLLDAVGTYFHHATPGLGPNLETDQCTVWGERQGKRALATMRYLDGVLADQPFLAGEQFTMADITAFAGLAFADFAQIAIPEDLTHLRAWRARVADRPSCAN